MTYRLLAFDIDGTIHDRQTDTPLTERTKQAVARVMETGAGVTLATGRTYESALMFSRNLGITLPIICYQGSLTSNPVTHEIVRETPLPLPLARRLIRFLEERGLNPEVYVREHCYVQKMTDAVRQSEQLLKMRAEVDTVDTLFGSYPIGVNRMTRERPLWLIVTGPPASGKTTLARRLAQDLRIPLFEKDVFKEVLYQALGFGDRDWSRRIGMSAVNLLFLTADRMLRIGASLVTESNFYRRLSSDRVGEIADNAKARVVQVHCSAPPDILVERNAARLAPSKLRSGHHVMPSEELLEGVRSGIWEPLDIPSKTIRVDTSSFFDYADVLQSIHQDGPNQSG